MQATQPTEPKDWKTVRIGPLGQINRQKARANELNRRRAAKSPQEKAKDDVRRLEAQRKWIAANREHVNEYCLRRLKKLGGKGCRRHLSDLLKRDDYVCGICDGDLPCDLGLIHVDQKVLMTLVAAKNA